MSSQIKEFHFFEIETDIIDFLRGEGKYSYRNILEVDTQIKKHNAHYNLHTNKYIGIVVDFENQKYFAPLTHDGQGN
jgi:hypothetical protein